MMPALLAPATLSPLAVDAKKDSCLTEPPANLDACQESICLKVSAQPVTQLAKLALTEFHATLARLATSSNKANVSPGIRFPQI
jgi:hypothetical protein